MKKIKHAFSVAYGAIVAAAVLGPGSAFAADSSVGQYGGAGGEVGGDVAQGASAGAGAGSDAGLAFTGLDVMTLLAIGVALVAAGLVMNRLVVHSRHAA